mmetsp:Transcript_16703/g.25026  ORF Transcript_16703/g.25026 Transcript_16703/m.25026 type:complete len:232 (-) Transcript_16703:64-759(-)
MQKILFSVVAIIIAAAIPNLQKSLNNYLMGFFRDMARVKARNRRMKSDAVISFSDIKSIIMDKDDDPLQDVVDQIMSGDGKDPNDDAASGDLPIYTREELYEFGHGDSGVLLLSIFGRIYDVSSGEKYYGKDGKYHLFAGRDATRALATGCLREHCLGSKTSDREPDSDVFELNEKSIKEAKKWVAFFETHDKYSHVGSLKDGESIEHLIDALLEQETECLCKKNATKEAQ